MSAIITAQSLEKIFYPGSEQVVAVDQINIIINEGDFVSVV